MCVAYCQLLIRFTLNLITLISLHLLKHFKVNESLQLNDYYSPFRRDRNRHGGGLCIYVKNSIYAVRCIELENDNIECIWLKIIMNNKRFYFCCAYRPPISNVEFWDLLNKSIEKVKDINFPNFFLVARP